MATQVLEPAPQVADAEVVIALWIVVGLLVLLGWPAVIMFVALVQERHGRRRAER